jgi:hypothetical protein
MMPEQKDRLSMEPAITYLKQNGISEKEILIDSSVEKDSLSFKNLIIGLRNGLAHLEGKK